MSYEQILAVDPGGTVGWATTDLRVDYLWPDAVDAGESTPEEFLDRARAALTGEWLVVCERFTISSHTATLTAGGTHDALDVIGCLKHLTRWAGGRFEFQTPAQAKKFVSNDQLRTLGLWRPAQDHARDAIRHLVLGMVQYGPPRVREDLTNRMAG